MLCVGDRNYIAALEVRSIEAFQTRDRRFGYNSSLGGDFSPTLVPEIAARGGATRQGRPVSVEQRAQIAATLTGHPVRPETRAKISASLTGQPSPKAGTKFSPEARATLSAAMIASPLTGARIAELAALNRGRKISPEARAKMSATHKKLGTRPPTTPEALAANAAARRGRKHSPEHRAKISASGIGRKHSPEALAKIRAARARQTPPTLGRRCPRRLALPISAPPSVAEDTRQLGSDRR
jgi:hypothetical protein